MSDEPSKDQGNTPAVRSINIKSKMKRELGISKPALPISKCD